MNLVWADRESARLAWRRPDKDRSPAGRTHVGSSSLLGSAAIARERLDLLTLHLNVMASGSYNRNAMHDCA